MVSAPNRVEKIQIGYAKQAKKMDMRRLKAVEWNILQTSCFEQDKENDTDNVNEAEKRKPMKPGSNPRQVLAICTQIWLDPGYYLYYS